MLSMYDAAYFAGQEDFKAGIPFEDNPFKKYTQSYYGWKMGWLEAKKEYYQEKRDTHPSGLA